MIRVGAAGAGALAAIHAEAFEAAWDAPTLADLLAAPGGFALADPDFDGFVLIRGAADEAEVLTLAVKPSARRQGLARRLMHAGALQSAQSGARTLFLEVAADNGAARALYAAAGFEPAGRRPGYYPRPDGGAVDALVLKKPLPPPA